jgi:hypothetical protein
MAEYFDLTTMAQDVRDQGRQIARHMVDAVLRPAEVVPVELRSPTRLVVRSTTAVLGSEPRTVPAHAGGGYGSDDRWLFDPAEVGELVSPVYTKRKEKHSSEAHN